MNPRRGRFLLWLMIAAGTLLRFAWCWTHQGDLIDDRDGYIAHAQSVSRGEGFLGPYSHRPTAFRPPGYPIAIGMLQRTGLSAASAVSLFNGVSSVMMLFTSIGLVRQMTVRSYSPALVVCVFLIAFDPLLIRYTSLPMTEVPCAAILLCAVSLLVHAVDDSSDPFCQTQSEAVVLSSLAGIMFAAGSLVRPVVLVAFAAAMFVVTLNSLTRRRRHKQVSQEVRDSVVRRFPVIVTVLVSFTVAMSPWIIRNWLQFGQLIPATTHGGYTLALGNNPDFYRDVIRGTDQFPWDGDALDRWQKRMIQQASLDGIQADSETAIDAWYYKQARAAITDDRSSFVKACWLRLSRFWAISTADESVPQSIKVLTSGWYAFVWLGLILNLISLGKRVFKPTSNRGTEAYDCIHQVVLWFIVAAFVGMHLVYWTDTRMRAPVMPLLAILSAIGWTATVPRWNRPLPESQ